MLKLTLATAILLAGITPAFAQAPASDTIKAMIAKGSKISIMGMEFSLTFKADGAYDDGQGSGGKYRVDGSKLCMTPEAFGQEICNDYPVGKKSGDSFEITSDFGPMLVTIK